MLRFLKRLKKYLPTHGHKYLLIIKELEKKCADLAEENRVLHEKIASLSEIILAKDSFLEKVKHNLSKVDNPEVKKIVRTVNSKKHGHDEYFRIFVKNFNSQYSGFIDRLTKKHPELTEKNIKLCALIKQGIDNLEIGNHFGTDSESVKKARYRLKKKLKLIDISLKEYINSI